MTILETLKELSNACGVAGREEQIATLVAGFLKPHVDSIREDKLGNIIGIKNGKKKTPKIMLAAHMDEIGLIVKNICDSGFLRFGKIGGIDDRVLAGQKVTIQTENRTLSGIIGSKPPHIQKEDERKKVLDSDDLFIDIGASSKEEATEMGVKAGDTAVFDVTFARISKDIVVGKALDNRIGCAVLIETFRRLKEPPCPVYAVGTVQEEVGLRGAGPSTFSISPDVGIALEATFATDTPDVKESDRQVKMRKGPALTVADSGMIVPTRLLRLFVKTAEEKKIPYQLETGVPGSTDAARMLLTKEGVPSGVISVPVRYIHSATSMLSIDDAENTTELVLAIVHAIAKHF